MLPASKLSAKLHRKNVVGQAFRRMIQAGCNPDDLQRWLVMLQSQSQIFPLSRTRSYFPVERRRKLERVAADLEHAVAELSVPEAVWIFTLGDLRGDIFQYVQQADVVEVLRRVAVVVRNAINRLGGVKQIDASEHIAAIIGAVVEQTGKPHYEEMATLIGEVLENPEFSADTLKMMIYRQKPRHKRR